LNCTTIQVQVGVGVGVSVRVLVDKETCYKSPLVLQEGLKGVRTHI